jgi:hypothetical protein
MELVGRKEKDCGYLHRSTSSWIREREITAALSCIASEDAVACDADEWKEVPIVQQAIKLSHVECHSYRTDYLRCRWTMFDRLSFVKSAGRNS